MTKRIALGLVLSSVVIFAADMSLQEMESLWIWIALFALGLIGVVILFVSSRQMAKIDRMHKEMLEKQKEIERSQSLFWQISVRIFMR